MCIRDRNEENVIWEMIAGKKPIMARPQPKNSRSSSQVSNKLNQWEDSSNCRIRGPLQESSHYGDHRTSKESFIKIFPHDLAGIGSRRRLGFSDLHENNYVEGKENMYGRQQAIENDIRKLKICYEEAIKQEKDALNEAQSRKQEVEEAQQWMSSCEERLQTLEKMIKSETNWNRGVISLENLEVYIQDVEVEMQELRKQLDDSELEVKKGLPPEVQAKLGKATFAWDERWKEFFTKIGNQTLKLEAKLAEDVTAYSSELQRHASDIEAQVKTSQESHSKNIKGLELQLTKLEEECELLVKAQAERSTSDLRKQLDVLRSSSTNQMKQGTNQVEVQRNQLEQYDKVFESARNEALSELDNVRQDFENKSTQLDETFHQLTKRSQDISERLLSSNLTGDMTSKDLEHFQQILSQLETGLSREVEALVLSYQAKFEAADKKYEEIEFKTEKLFKRVHRILPEFKSGGMNDKGEGLDFSDFEDYDEGVTKGPSCTSPAPAFRQSSNSVTRHRIFDDVRPAAAERRSDSAPNHQGNRPIFAQNDTKEARNSLDAISIQESIYLRSRGGSHDNQALAPVYGRHVLLPPSYY
eukprot:TRINITY_DN5848_c0_g1_i5.p1 TRINITY_DN5848_c0_g1~~TRINITY_DN5848_c0_g1_i5.p1  ORF type:complete len:614 (+),score=123.62 TRINITY_DN5848_c0_g1_i5:87-1844(+)